MNERNNRSFAARRCAFSIIAGALLAACGRSPPPIRRAGRDAANWANLATYRDKEVSPNIERDIYMKIFSRCSALATCAQLQYSRVVAATSRNQITLNRCRTSRNDRWDAAHLGRTIRELTKTIHVKAEVFGNFEEAVRGSLSSRARSKAT
ncbi:MAG TPA: hypothetical protein VGG70_06880 [Candidatus Cybelea sp.]|jgi:hypothetical protein